MFKFLKDIGPGPLIAAAFIGPGTVTVCTKAGANFGFDLLWALLISVFATIILQSMSARLGLISRKSLSEAAASVISTKTLKFIVLGLILLAILLGNSAYQAGNILGGVLGLETVIEGSEIFIGDYVLRPYILLLSLVAFIMLYIGKYKVIERILVSLVVLMSLTFIITAIITAPEIGEIFKGLFGFNADSESWLMIMGLIGTTVVPYNLFLHSSLVKEKWASKSSLSKMTRDTLIAIGLGGFVSMCILITAASTKGMGGVNNVSDLALGLEHLFGSSAKYFLATGLFAAGLTSAITAPLAAAYVARGIFGWKNDLKAIQFRLVWLAVLVIGVVFAHLGASPIEIITIAQVANALVLPIVVILLLWIMNQPQIMGEHTNTLLQNIFGFSVLLIISMLTTKTFLSFL
ncbi:MAG: Nramp family divalent metal transporter [Crocinitomicaceae bacterium]|nr:Nramp family divalent metal transporter [Crocinitomicaceae bacterium]